MKLCALALSCVFTVAACGGTPTAPSPTPGAQSVQPFVLDDRLPLFRGVPVPSFSGQWQGTAQQTDCHGPAPSCSRAGTGAFFFPPVVTLKVVQAGTALSGALTFRTSETTISGSVRADGALFVSGDGPLEGVRMVARFTRTSDDQLAGTVVEEQRNDGQLTLTFRYDVTVIKQQ